MQRWHILPPAMKCPSCGRTSTRLYKGYKERGAGRCPRCRTVHVASYEKRQLRARLSVN